MSQILITTLVISACMGLSFLFSGMEAGVLALSRAAGAAVDADGQPAGGDFARLPGEAGGFFVDDSGGEYAGEPRGGGPTGSVAASMAGKLAGAADGGFLAVMFLFYALCDLLPKMLFQKFPNRLCMAMARPFRFVHMALVAAGAFMTRLSRGMLHWTGGKTFTGNLFGEPGGDAVVHAGIAFWLDIRRSGC